MAGVDGDVRREVWCGCMSWVWCRPITYRACRAGCEVGTRHSGGQGGEIHITDAIRSLIKKENKFYGNIFKGKYLDCGTLSGYINSGIQISKGK